MKISRIFAGRTLAVAAMAALALTTAWADEYAGPKITSYYPAKNDENPSELKTTMKAYVYFETGSKIEWAKAHVIKDGETIGDCIYKKSTFLSNNATLTQTDPDNAVVAALGGGQFTFSFYGVSWQDSNGEMQQWEDTAASIAEVTYRRNGVNGTITGQTGFEDGKMLSYYPAGSDAGVLTLTFSKALMPTGEKAQFTYGGTERPVDIPLSVSEDGLQLTIDFRGICYNVDTLAPGVVFKDDNGNVTDPPTTIGLGISGLYCTDGMPIQTTMMGHTFEGSKYFQWDYEDITLPTPVLTKAEFFASANPSETFLNINASTDKMCLYIDNLSSLVSADVLLEVGALQETIPFAEITTTEDCYTISLPASIKAAGSSGLSILLANCVYAREDGAQHVIEPLTFNRVANEKFTIAELKESEVGAEVVLVGSDIRITFSNADMLYTFGEDATAGVQFITEDGADVVFPQGASINGRIAGKYLGDDLFMVDLANSDYELGEANITYGKVVGSIAELTASENLCMLVTLVFTDALATEMADDTTLIVSEESGDFVAVPFDHVAGLELPNEGYNSITGVATTMGGYMPILLIRDANDIDVSSHNAIDMNVAGDADTTVIYNLDGTQANGLSKGLYIVNGKKVIVK